MRENETINAKVVAVHDYGIDVEAEGLRGFIQPTELSWTAARANHDDLVAVGDVIEVFVTHVTPHRFSASLKRAHPELDHWRDSSIFAVGSVHDGVIKKVVEWGCEVEIAPGVCGMILLDTHPGRYLSGVAIKVEVVTVDLMIRKLKLKPYARLSWMR
jgi:small subunit ribosomal protein S1